MRFELEKWYLDAVADDGRGLIAYHASVRLGLLPVRYGAVLQFGAGPTEERSTLRPRPAPAVATDGGITWSCPQAGLDGGTWQPIVEPVQRCLLDDERGSLQWDCVQPAARAAVTMGRRAWRGFGYVERLRMTVPPWRLPIDELAWGRFVDEHGSLVWIDWRGPQPLRVLLLDGVDAGAGTVATDRIAAADGSWSLELSDSECVREGALGDTVLARVPLVRNVVPSTILALHETKWRSRGRLQQGGRRREGWVLHEIVRFPAR